MSKIGFKAAFTRWLNPAPRRRGSRRLLTAWIAFLALAVPCALQAAPKPESAPESPPTSAPASAPAATTAATTGTTNGDAPAYPAPAGITGPTSAFHDSVAARYDYAFGKDMPFFPSNATTTTGQFVSPRSFPTAQYCGHCHQEAYRQWRQSVHSNSFRAPWYLKNVNLLIDEKGVQFSRHCEGCHNPVALLSGDLSQGMPKKRPFEEEGITCSTCHSIVSTDTTGTGSYVMGIPAVLVDENGAPVTGAVSDAEILAHLDRHSKAVMRPLYQTAEFCAACHKAAIPRPLDDYKWLRAFTVYDEWQGASFTRQSPLPFYRKDVVSTCQTCHMPREALASAAIDPGAKDGKLVSHRWLGGNTLMPQFYNFDEQARKLVAFLKDGPDGKGVLNVDIFALEKESAAATKTEPGSPATGLRRGGGDEVLVAPLGLTRFSLVPGETLVADVVIQNKGIAHSFIPEQRDFYEAWVDFTVKDASGKTLAESGFIQPDGNLDPSAHSFTNRLINIKGELNDLHQVWRNRVLAYNNAFQSGRSQLVRYRFRLPKNESGPIAGQFSLTATVRYRRFNQHFIDYAMADKHYLLPVIDMATETRTFKIGENAPLPLESQGHSLGAQPSPGAQPSLGAQPLPNPEWMRWNNYGIALFDAQQYQAAVHAFERVAALRPDYADAFTNRSVVEVSWEKYDDARANLTKALALLPGDPRALYYRALVERNQGQVKLAIADLQAVLEKYPRAKDALRELGFSYYQQHQYAEARSAYERLQIIDPDDLAAHYQLAILYRRLGDKQKAAIESAKFADQKDDPTASTYALEFLAKHPEVAAESVVWHTHDLTGDPVKKPEKIEYKYIPGAGE
jgi:tetratricopeptide (TPR) repeat protein